MTSGISTGTGTGEDMECEDGVAADGVAETGPVAGTVLGSTVLSAMSSNREVAASNLATSLVSSSFGIPESIVSIFVFSKTGKQVGLAPWNKGTYRFIRVVRLCICELLAAILSGRGGILLGLDYI